MVYMQLMQYSPPTLLEKYCNQRQKQRWKCGSNLLTNAFYYLCIYIDFKNKRESLHEFYRGHFCLGNLRFYTTVHKSRSHQQVCRTTWKAILSQIFFREKNNV